MQTIYDESECLQKQNYLGGMSLSRARMRSHKLHLAPAFCSGRRRLGSNYVDRWGRDSIHRLQFTGIGR